MKKLLKIMLAALLILVLIGAAGFVIWSQITYSPSEELETSISLDEIEQEENWLVFQPENPLNIGFILYPGAKVEPESYSYYASRLAEAGYTVIIPHVNLNFAILDIDVASMIMEHFDEIDRWYVGGHSLGGVAAASFANDHQENVKGVIFLASYPGSSDNLSNTGLAVLSLSAEHDLLTTADKIENSKALLPKDTRYYEIKGGNHAQFGMYGEQNGDGEATIDALEQQEILIKETLEWLNNQWQKHLSEMALT